MKIFLTFDYELFFGERSGTAEKCILAPTQKLIEIAKKYAVQLTFFIDCGYLVALKKYSSDHPELEKEYKLVSAQIKLLTELGHSCELHIHPHWEDSSYNEGKWIFDVRRYKLSDFSEEDILMIFKKYKTCLEEITGKPSTVYRAGGWCLQPFSKIENTFREMGIKLDSTVYQQGYLNSDTHFYDFRNAPDKEQWRFTEDLCKEDINGKYLEVPISSYKYSPVFFWKLYGLGRLFRNKHKAGGDGTPIPTKGIKRRYLTASQILPVSSDGYFASALSTSYRKLKREKKSNMVVIGHPKACTLYSFAALEKFIAKEKDKNSFATLSSLL